MASTSAGSSSLNKLSVVVPKPMNALQSMVQSTTAAAAETEAEASLAAADKQRSPSADVASSNTTRDNRIVVVNEAVVGPFGKSSTSG